MAALDPSAAARQALNENEFFFPLQVTSTYSDCIILRLVIQQSHSLPDAYSSAWAPNDGHGGDSGRGSGNFF